MTDPAIDELSMNLIEDELLVKLIEVEKLKLSPEHTFILRILLMSLNWFHEYFILTTLITFDDVIEICKKSLLNQQNDRSYPGSP